MWTDTLNRYVAAIGPCSPETKLARELIDPNSYKARLPRIAEPYADFFGPYETPQSRYPLTRLGSYARLDRHYLPYWVNLKSLLDCIVRTVDLSPSAASPLTADLVAAIGLIGSLTYDAEWVSDPETAADLDNCASAPSVLDANVLLAADLVRQMKGRVNQPLRVLDIGVGRGNTIIPVLEQLVKANCPTVHVSLLDISVNSLRRTVARLKKALKDLDRVGNSEMCVEIDELIHCNLVELGYSVRSRADHYDAIVSGGTLFHSTDKERIFRWARRSLRPDGVFILWDWFAPCWAAPRLVAGIQSRHLSSDLYQVESNEIAAVEQTWLHGWLGPRGYFNYWSDSDYGELRADFVRHMQGLRVGKPFSFVAWLFTIADSFPPPALPGHYLCIEGYSSVTTYLADSVAAGFRVVEVATLDQLRQRHREQNNLAGNTDFYRDTIKMVTLENDGAQIMEVER